MQKTIAFDWDDTITADPVLMAGMMHACYKAGWRVIVVTQRRQTEENYAVVNEWLIENKLAMVPIYFTSLASKTEYMRKAKDQGRVGWVVDVWVDDNPVALVNGR